MVLNNKYNEFTNLNRAIAKGEDFIKHFKFINIIEKNFNEVTQQLNKFTKIKELEIKLKQLNLEVKFEKNNIVSNNKEIEKDVEEYTEYLKKLGKCPVCLSEINENSIEHVLNELKGDILHE